MATSTLLPPDKKASRSHQRQTFPQIMAMALFQPYTATGKLKAVMIPTRPTGFHCSMSAWPGPEDREGKEYARACSCNACQIIKTKV